MIDTLNLLALASLPGLFSPPLIVDAEARALLSEAWLAGADTEPTVPGMR